MNWETFSVSALGAAFAGLIYFLYGQIAARLGWSREDKKAAGARIDRVDATARAEIARVEAALNKALGSHDRKLARLEEHVKHLPTTDSITALAREVSEGRRETARLAAAQEAQAATMRTILEYLIGKETKA